MLGRRVLVILVALAAFGLPPRGASAGSDERIWDHWSRLRLRAHGGVVFRGRVELRRLDSAGERRLETDVTASLLGATVARTTTRTVLDLETGRPRSHETRSRKRARRYEFGPTGYTVQKLEPRPGEGAAQWNVTSSKEFPYPRGSDGQPVPVFDYYGMLLHLRSTELDQPGDEVTIHVATAGGARPYHIVVETCRTSKRKVTDLADDVTRSLDVRECRLRVIPSDPSEQGFLGMEGETEVWVETTSKAPVEVSGRVPGVPGRVTVTLTGIESSARRRGRRRATAPARAPGCRAPGARSARAAPACRSAADVPGRSAWRRAQGRTARGGS
jgi:hypothetical protein